MLEKENTLCITLCIPIKNTYIFHLFFPRLVLEKRKICNEQYSEWDALAEIRQL